jgi:hypothetical protein
MMINGNRTHKLNTHRKPKRWKLIPSKWVDHSDLKHVENLSDLIQRYLSEHDLRSPSRLPIRKFYVTVWDHSVYPRLTDEIRDSITWNASLCRRQLLINIGVFPKDDCDLMNCQIECVFPKKRTHRLDILTWCDKPSKRQIRFMTRLLSGF